MASYKIFFLCIHISFLSFRVAEAQIDPSYLYPSCSSEKTHANTSFQSVIKDLLYYLSSNASSHTEFYNITLHDKTTSDSIYGMFMCRGDVSSHLCQQCIINATQGLTPKCSLSKQAVIWYEECMVWYSTSYFFSTVTTKPNGFPMRSCAKISNPESFKHLLFLTMNETKNEAAHHPIGNKKFATKKANMSEVHTLYCLAQCTPDLSPDDCRTCLNGAIGDIPKCCEGRLGGRVLYPSCNIRYELYPFYSTSPLTKPPQQLVPKTKSSYDDLNLLKYPLYLSKNCSSNKSFTANSTFQIYLKTLLSYLLSNVTSGNQFHKANVADTVFGLFMCRGDLPYTFCVQCMLNATHRITSECNSSQEAIIWYNHCLLRYSYRNFFFKVETYPNFLELNSTNNNTEQFFTATLATVLDKVAVEAAESDKRFGKKPTKLNAFQTLYTLAQCTQDLSVDDCKSCLGTVMGTTIPWSRLGSIGGRVLYPSCNLRFELFQFYKNSDEASSPWRGSPPSGKSKGLPRTICLIIVPTIVSVMLFFVVYYFRKRKARKSHMTILKENFSCELATLEPLHFNLTTIEVATNNFSDENRIGKGGFGEVYKGILFDGRQIAVKRLSKSSNQGANEFKNEVLLIAKLQHRNLVEFIGFCLEEQEKILIYEYVPNKSLDYFLFDPQRQKLLSWFERYKIIQGIARGILYLHEHSRLKVIHRDLKPSNILLDENMIPKISDFGIARIVKIDQNQERTNLIVGTCGYMSPEYAMLGEFSEKSDIFSFGVMILEIITGRKNLSSYEPRRVDYDLPSYVWKQWRDQTPLRAIDPNIRKNYSETEVIKCIQIGLLCVQENPDARPTMVTVVLYLSSHFIELPSPQEPAFFSCSRMDAKTIAKQSSSKKFINVSAPISINEMPTSEFFPR